jgi:nitrogen regulatory protein P-II 1
MKCRLGANSTGAPLEKPIDNFDCFNLFFLVEVSRRLCASWSPPRTPPTFRAVLRHPTAISFWSKGEMMKKLEAIIQPSRFESVKDALLEMGVGGLTVTEVRGHGRQKGHTEVYRGREYTVDLLPKIKLEVVLPDGLADEVVAIILKTAKTGKIGDGKIFLSNIDEAVRIRNGERGETAL